MQFQIPYVMSMSTTIIIIGKLLYHNTDIVETIQFITYTATNNMRLNRAVVDKPLEFSWFLISNKILWLEFVSLDIHVSRSFGIQKWNKIFVFISRWNTFKISSTKMYLKTQKLRHLLGTREDCKRKLSRGLSMFNVKKSNWVFHWCFLF